MGQGGAVTRLPLVRAMLAQGLAIILVVGLS